MAKRRRGANRRTRKAAGRSHITKQYPNRASYDLGQRTVALRAETNARHAPVPVSHHLILSQDHDAQPGLTLIGTVNLECAASTMTLDPGPSDVDLDRVERDLRDTIIRGHLRPIFHACLGGERSAQNGPLLFRRSCRKIPGLRRGRSVLPAARHTGRRSEVSDLYGSIYGTSP